jgi:hypothetical protein
MHKRLLTATAILVLLIGCASSGGNRTVVTGTTRPPIQADQVKVYSSPPYGCEEVASLMAEANGSSQKSLDRAMQKLKEAAASLGANGLILQRTTVNKMKMMDGDGIPIPILPSWGSETGVSAVAIYVR